MNLAGLSQFHENEALISAAQSIAGRLALWAVAIGLLAWHEVSLLMLAALSLVMIFPVQRHALLSLAAAGMIVEKMLEATDLHWQDHVVQLAALLAAGIGGLYIAYLLVKHFQKWPAVIRRFPILTLHASIWLVLSLSTLPMLGALAMAPFLVWRLSYMVALGSRGKAGATRFRDHLFYLVPVYGGTQTPYGKGLFGKTARYLTIWPADWSFDLPGLAEHLRTGIYPAWYQGWAAVYLELFQAVLRLAVAGHVIIGCLRLLGFNVFRNTYKPLLAESILEFWNRFYYYFKELLVDFFFYPAYLRLRSLGPRARMFVAVFAAAFMGNMYHHILASPDTVIHLDLAGFWIAWGSRFVYCFLLAVGIWVSMLRQQKLRLTGVKASLPLRLRRIAGVWTFYGLIHVWSISPQDASIGDRLAFFMSLFSL